MPSRTEPKFKLPGATTNPLPVPARVEDDGLFMALLSKASEPEVLPAAAGVNVTEKFTLCPEAIVKGKVIPLKPKPAPVSVSKFTITLAPLAVRVPVCGALVVPRATLLKVKLAGLNKSWPPPVKFTPVTLALLIATVWLAGAKTRFPLLGVTV